MPVLAGFPVDSLLLQPEVSTTVQPSSCSQAAAHSQPGLGPVGNITQNPSVGLRHRVVSCLPSPLASAYSGCWQGMLQLAPSRIQICFLPLHSAKSS